MVRSQKTAGLIGTIRGTKAEFPLRKPAQKINVADVVQASEERIALVPPLTPDRHLNFARISTWCFMMFTHMALKTFFARTS